jgi:phenylalanyl-tRNA synthetase beta chain
MIKSPIDYKVIEPSHKFVPLGYEKEMTLPEILEKHEKGHEFGDIVKDYGHYPILLSADGLTLSLPPIINSNDVGRITEETRECLIEVTGTNYETVNVILNILCQTFVEHGAQIFSVEIEYPTEIKSKKDINPNLEIEEIELDINVLNKYLGTKLALEEVSELVEKRRFNCTPVNKSTLKVAIPPYRKDILHWVDISEEIAIAMDLNKMGPTKWKVLTAGGLLPETESENLVRDLLLGLGGTELITFTLTDPDTLTEKVNLENRKLVRIENPVSKTYSVLRDQLFPVLVNVLSKNTHEMYPQTIYEVGEVAKITSKSVVTQTNAVFLHADADASFEDAHKRLDSLLSVLRTPYKIEKLVHPSFTEGRCGKIIINKKECGIIGELSPAVLEMNQIWVPVVGFEIELPLIPTLNCVVKETY